MTSSTITAVNHNEPMDPPHPRADGPRRRRAFTASDKIAHCMPMSRRANTVKAAPICGGRACIRRCSANGASNATPGCWRANGPARRLAGSPPNRPRLRGSPANSLGRTSGCTPPRPPWPSWKCTRCLGVTVRESGLRRAAQEALTETFAMLTGHGVSTRQAATLTGLVCSTATRRRNAATALTPAVCTEPAVEPANKLTDAERRRVVEVPTSDRFVDLAPLQIYAQLLDEGV